MTQSDNLLFVGDLSSRKGLGGLLDALEILRRKSVAVRIRLRGRWLSARRIGYVTRFLKWTRHNCQYL